MVGNESGAPSIATHVRSLLNRMTLEEKVGQLVQYSSRTEVTGPAKKAAIEALIASGGVGSLLNVSGAAETHRWQKLAVENSRLGIPLLFGLDVIHGYRTIFPIPLGSAASWDLGLIEQSERVAATEAAAAGLHWTFAPMVDIGRDARWGRISEGSGEDPYLGSAVARARIAGFQGSNLAAVDTVLACAKHFAAYGAAQAGRDYFTTDVTERVLREVYFPPFRAAVEAGVETFMAAFNDLDGTPCTAHAFLLERVLRQEWGFAGLVVSDWNAIDELRAHGFAESLSEAAQHSVLAGLDMDMQSEAYTRHLADLVRAGTVPESRLEAAVSRVLTAKFRLGLFSDPYRYSDEKRERDTMLRPEFLELARDLARRSCVLLKNQGTLPLRKTGQKIALVGPLADAPLHQLGAWHGRGREGDSETIRTALSAAFPGEMLRYERGCEVRGVDTSGFVAARAIAADADVIIAVLGEDASQSGEAASRTSLDLSGPQLALLEALHQTGKPIVLVLVTGRPLLLEAAHSLANSILIAWHPGTKGGPAIVDVLTGDYNPSGHLPITWPRSVGQIPIFYAHKNSGRPALIDAKPKDRFYSHYIDSPNTPLYPFGFGLSYTTFSFEQLRVSAPVVRSIDASLTVTVRVSNTGSLPGEVVVQLYLRDRVGSVTRPVRELKGFKKVDLAVGASQNVTFQLGANDLAFWRADMTYGLEPGVFDVFVGADSTATLTAQFVLE